MSRARPSDPRLVKFGAAELLQDADRPDGWYLLVDGVPQSYVDLGDPTHLEFEYVRRIGDVLDSVGAAGGPLRVLHIGGAGLTLPRYIAATRPGSRQLVFEPDEALLGLVRERLPWPRGARIRVRVADGRAGLAAVAEGAYDAMVVDAFTGDEVPEHLTTVESLQEAARVLAPEGVYLLNVGDGPPLTYARRVASTLLTVFADAMLLAEPAVLRGRHFGNLVLVGSSMPLPRGEVSRRAASSIFPARVLDRAAMQRFTGGAPVSSDAAPAPSPRPPEDLWRSPPR